ncbi:MMPL family transporter [uncultured Pseudoteredinibacter sp.]|uniref:MMPL family transporter n=1 Tax=uncultured Pseudoteredinibacter sp. TaxID=1641701 RepID=UPI00263593A5|nr:MMPL family transporter [uncultured Pseudoteredinibacter sp.]
MKTSNAQKLLLAFWLLIISASIGIIATTLTKESRFESNILKLLPYNNTSPTIQAAETKLNNLFSRRAALIIPETQEKDTAIESVKLIKRKLNESGLFSSIITGPSRESIQASTKFYNAYRYSLLSPADKQALKSDHKAFIDEAIIQRNSLFSLSQSTNILEDPGLTYQNWLSQLTNGSQLKLDKNGFFAQSEQDIYRVVFLQLTGSPFEQDYQSKVITAIQNAKHTAQLRNPKLEVFQSGLLFHAQHASSQAKKEISTIGLGSTIGAVILLLFAFRSAKPILLSLSAIAFGFLGALAICLIVFHKIHLITLAFGASLIGVSIDYSFHFFSSQQRNPNKILKRIGPALALALTSSAMAYLSLTLTPFPGLKQMGLFSAAGLSISCLTVLAIFPLFPPVPQRTTPSIFNLIQNTKRPNAYLTLLVSTLLAALIGCIKPWNFQDDVRLLNSSPEKLIKDEKLSQALIGGMDSSRYLLFKGGDWESILQKQEELQQDFIQMTANKKLGGIQLLSQYIPSIQKQRESQKALAEYVYNKESLNYYFERLGLPESAAAHSLELYKGSAANQLSWSAWSSSPIAELASHLWVETSSNEKAAIAALKPPIDPLSLSALNSDQVQYIDKVSNISLIMKQYRLEILLLLALSYGVVLLILSIRFKQHALFIILVPLMSTLCAFSLMSLMGISLNIFSVLASLLVLGIGLDMGIVLREESYSRHAWQTISLSACTTLLAFGLLSLSETPVLYHFGLTILLGITFNWFFSWSLSAKQHSREYTS